MCLGTLPGLDDKLDAPSLIDHDGSRYWFLDGKLHRTNGPAIIRIDGFRCWMLNDEVHRDDGPAMVYPDGTEVWYHHGDRIAAPV